MLATSGTPADLQRCGLKNLKSCLKFRQLFGGKQATPCNDAGGSGVASSIPAAGSAVNKKLSAAEMAQLLPEEKRTYLIK